MSDDRPVPNQINLVVSDMEATLEFFRTLGAEIEPMPAPWDRHHRHISTLDGLDFDIDSAEFVTKWNPAWPPGRTGPVIGFRVPSREAVDRIYDDLTGAGHVGQQPPYDAFMGARYAVVTDPDGNAIGLMSPIDPARASIPPAPGEEPSSS